MNTYLKLTNVRLLQSQTTSQKKQSQLTELNKFLEHKRADIHQNITWFLDNKKTNHILWGGKDEHGFEIRSGLYFVRFEDSNKSIIKKVTYLK